MKKYEYVEDYLEVISGLRDRDTLKPVGLGWFDPIIQLARYDIPVFSSMSETTMSGRPLTEKQGHLLVKLIDKYRRQLSNLQIDSHLRNLNKFRNQFRVVDETRFLTVADGEIKLRFPFDAKLIEQIREFAKNSQGKCWWDRDDKVWRAALTEYNINWLVAWSKKNSFQVTDEALHYMTQIEEAEKQIFKIELTYKEGNLVIDNAPKELLSYINEKVGGLAPTNLVKLVDYSSTLGYSVDKKILDILSNSFDEDVCKMLLTKETIFDPAQESSFALIKKYAEATNRWPVVVVNSTVEEGILDSFYRIFSANKVVIVNKKSKWDVDSDVRVVYSTRPVTQPTSLLVTTSGVITGSSRQMMIQSAEKVVFLSASVYNNKRKSTVNKFK